MSSEQAFWVLFHGRESGCVMAPNEDEALCIAHEETGMQPYSAVRMPTPAHPLINGSGAGNWSKLLREKGRGDSPPG